MKSFITRLKTSKSLLGFLWKERLWWMIPFVVTLLVVAILLVFAHTSPIVPFLYTAF
jgi:hypothetical protein